MATDGRLARKIEARRDVQRKGWDTCMDPRRARRGRWVLHGHKHAFDRHVGTLLGSWAWTRRRQRRINVHKEILGPRHHNEIRKGGLGTNGEGKWHQCTSTQSGATKRARTRTNLNLWTVPVHVTKSTNVASSRPPTACCDGTEETTRIGTSARQTQSDKLVENSTLVLVAGSMGDMRVRGTECKPVCK